MDAIIIPKPSLETRVEEPTLWGASIAINTTVYATPVDLNHTPRSNYE
jgi:hypothetical protein